MQLKPGEPFVDSARGDRRLGDHRALSRSRLRARQRQARDHVRTGADRSGQDARPVRVRFVITEGPANDVSAPSPSRARRSLPSRASARSSRSSTGRPFYRPQLDADRDSDRAPVSQRRIPGRRASPPSRRSSTTGSGIDLDWVIREGPADDRRSRAGQRQRAHERRAHPPRGRAAAWQAARRRRHASKASAGSPRSASSAACASSKLPHGSSTSRDVLIEVEEAPVDERV